ncbi:MAG: DNA-binding domain-containing protein [Pseudomonadota bacterium]
MSALADFQRTLAAHVRCGSVVPPGWVAEGPVYAAERRLTVYHDAYRLRLAEALGEDFPLLRALLGEAGFDRLTRRYLAACPSRSWTLRDLGRGLPRFLVRRPALRATATFEWALLDAFDAADGRTLTAADLGVVPPQHFARLRFAMAPGVQVLRMRWNVPQSWSAWHGGAAATVPARLPAPLDCLISRRQERVYFRTLSADESAALAALRRGRSFGAICGAVARAGGTDASPDGAPARAAQLLATWLAEGLLAAT